MKRVTGTKSGKMKTKQSLNRGHMRWPWYAVVVKQR